MSSVREITHPTENSGIPGIILPSFKATGQMRPQRLLLHAKPGATVFKVLMYLSRAS